MAEKIQYLMVRISKEQKKILEAKSRNAGFRRKSDYVRSLLFQDFNTSQMIKEIYENLIKNV